MEPEGTHANSRTAYRFGSFELNAATRQLLADGQPVSLGARGFDVLLALVERRERLVTKDELLEIVWPGVVVEENNLQVQISALRKLMGPRAIATIPGRGYRFTLALNEASQTAGSSAETAVENELHHRLTAILAADVAGYSRMMETDERATVAALDQVRAVFRKEIEANRGRVVDMAGDSVLALFDAATGAVATALAVQQQIEAAAAAQPEERRMRVRIGVHLGDVFVKPDHTVYGNGVNVAARLQALASPGGICISQTLYDTVKRKLTLQAEFAGPQSFKNIAEPVPVWHVVSGSAELPASPPPPAPAELPKTEARRARWVVAAALTAVVLTAVGGTWWWAKRESAEQARVPDAKSIAVLPFANMSPDKDNVYFADGIQDDLLTQLSLLGELKVVSRTSVGEYRDTKKNLRQIGAELGVAALVEGAVRRSGDRVRVTVQLIDARTDKHLWSQSYDRELKDIFAIQSELSTEIAKALKVSLGPRDDARIARKPTESLEAYELFLRADESQRAALMGFNVGQGLTQRIGLLSRAVELDPKFTLAWSRLAVEHARAYFWAFDRRPARQAWAQQAIDRALTLAPDDLSVRSAAGNVYYYGYSDFARAAQHFEALLRIAPNHVQTLIQLSWVRRRQGRWIDANALLEQALAVDARNVDALANLSENLLFFRHFDRALALQRRIIELRPGSIDAQAKLHEIESAPTGSFEAYDRWRATLQPGVERTSLLVWLMDARRAVAQRDFDAVLRLCDRPPGQLEATGTLLVSEYRALALLAKGERAQSLEIARSMIREATHALEKQLAGHDVLLERLAFAKAILGDRTGALRDLERARALHPAHDALESEKFAETEAIVYALLGERQRTLELLRERAKRPMIASLWWVPNARNREPYYVRLWDDPEFKALVADPANWAPLPFFNEDPAPAAGKARGV